MEAYQEVESLSIRRNFAVLSDEDKRELLNVVRLVVFKLHVDGLLHTYADEISVTSKKGSEF